MPDLNTQLQEAIALARAGQRDAARERLKAVVAADPKLELAWLWLASVTTDRAARITYLERALALNPNNPTSQQAYRELTGRTTPAGAQTAARPPAQPAPARPRPRISYGNVLFILGGLLVLVVALAIILSVFGGNDDTGSPQPTFPPHLLTPQGTPTPDLSATPSDTPRPTATEGPSSTPVTLPPTWTSAPSATALSTRTLVPTWTQQPTRTSPPTARPPTATFTPLPSTQAPDENILEATADAAESTPESTESVGFG
jgi:hypothetical protein